MSGNLDGLSERLCYLLSECWKGLRALLPECRALPALSDLLPECRVLPALSALLLECRVLPAQSDGCWNAGCCRLCQTVERCKIFESKVLPYCFKKIFDRGRSALILIPQIRNLGSCFVEFLQSSFRCFLIDSAFFLTIMFQVVLLTEYHASNRTERLH